LLNTSASFFCSSRDRVNWKGDGMTDKRLFHGKPEVLTPDDVAEILRVSRRKINQLVAADRIPFVRIEKGESDSNVKRL
jgi:excisionase family DNA binding protein